MQMIVHAPGATTYEMNAAIDAALTVFAGAGVEPWAAAVAFFKRESWEHHGFADEYEPSTQQMAAAEVWHEAQDAAKAACFRSWPADKVPSGWILEVRRV